ncbi:hypothetical protein A3844_07595 [Paenibacillus helianthi]|uniref:DUF3221 domain-containing protein n=1 Tax=Paenibacillus helianthi TaxID=1349432 RepID=A0ABX3EUX9_9BACL|nr:MULTISPECIES: hypothetical protein [Paenibacillus]OKP88552.1 hypothetical protein A3844_07595 [Paenibacillus helianthi]OKP89348.1 hypothetical protein A3842_04495 [Paenibacillus sp. P3E]OKP93024.1 hypothetical protein A3848_06520 [Paenibacillus sp. P32E]
MTYRKVVLGLLVWVAAAGLGACSNPGSETGEGHFRTLAQEGVDKSQYLPGDLPIPAGAGITFTEGEAAHGKKSSMLIYETRESMDELGSTYQKYVNDKSLKLGTQIVDRKNMIISGKVPNAYSYSIIGTSSASNPGSTEIIVTWIEN